MLTETQAPAEEHLSIAVSEKVDAPGGDDADESRSETLEEGCRAFCAVGMTAIKEVSSALDTMTSLLLSETAKCGVRKDMPCLNKSMEEFENALALDDGLGSMYRFGLVELVGV